MKAIDIDTVKPFVSAAIHALELMEKARERDNPRAEVALTAKRKAGDFLGQLNRDKVGRPEKFSTRGEYFQAIEEAEITPQDAARWQQIAQIPEETFKIFVQETKESGNCMHFWKGWNMQSLDTAGNLKECQRSQ